jgi:PKD repeat protein
MYWLPTKVDISPPGTTGWQTVDLTAQGVPANAVCVIRYTQTVSFYAGGARKTGSTDNRASNMAYSAQQTHVVCGVNASSQIDLSQVNANQNYFLVGWFTSDEAYYETTGVNKTPSGTGWLTVNVSANVPSGTKWVILELDSGSDNVTGYNFRYTGSGDVRQPSYNMGHAWFVVPLDTSYTFDFYKETNTTLKLYYVGYVKSGTVKTAGLNKSLSSTGSYVDIDLSADAPSDAIAAVVEVFTTDAASRLYDLRKNGNLDDFYLATYFNQTLFQVVELDAGKIIEGKISNASVDFYVWGYITSAAPTIPVCNFSADVVNGNVPLTVNFTDSSTGIPDYWTWDFGDGSAVDHTQNPTHIYTNTGTYTVSLTVSNALGWDNETKASYITTINIGTASLIFPAFTGLVESWGIDLTLPMFQIGAGGYWTDYNKMTFPMLQLLASGYIISNDGLIIFPALTISASGVIGIVGTANLILPALGLEAGQPPLADATLTFPMFTIIASGSVMQSGSAILTLPPLTLSGSGLVGILGTASLILPPFSAYGIGIVSLNITGDALLILPPLRVSATGEVLYAETFQVFAINTKNIAISKYTSYPYNSFAKFGNLYLASSSNGIFLLEGAKDETVNINSKFATGEMGMGLDKLKRVIDMILGMKSNGKYDLKVTTDDGVESSYELNDANAVSHPIRKKFGKGKKGKYWKLRIYNKDGSDFEIDSIQSTVDTLSRRA